MTRGGAASTMVRAGRRLWLGAVAIVVLVVLVLGSVALYRTVLASEREMEVITSDVPRVVGGLERAIGYGGFIHNFKNHVLRTGEGRYGVAAREDYATALGYLDELEQIAARAGVEMGIADLRATLAVYVEMLDEIDRLHAAGATIAEIDAAVRVPDEEAVDNLVVAQQALEAALRAELDRNRARITLLVLSLIGAFVLGNVLIAGTVIAGQRAKARDAERIAALNARLNAILETAQSGILGLSAEGAIVASNPGARALLPPEAFEAGSDWPDRVPVRGVEGMEALPGTANPFRRAAEGETIRDALVILGDGEAPRYLKLSSARISTGPADDVRSVILIDDVTELERNRQQVERTARLDALGQLTGGIAHDFNNLLGTIEYAVELARDDMPEPDNRYLDTARNAVRRGADLTRRLLTFARRQPGEIGSHEVEGLLAGVEDLSRPALDASITLAIPAPEPGLWVLCDEGQFETAMLNLVLNSRDAIRDSGRGSTITIGVRALDGMSRRQLGTAGSDSTPADFVEFSVSDDGPGMSAEVRRRATDPFFTTKGLHDGTGLGLSVVYGFVEQSGGVLKIYSEVGRGTTVRLILPRGAAGTRTDKAVEAQVVPSAGGEHILVVDDQPDLLAITRDMLEGFGYRVTAARSGAEALERLSSAGRCDLLLTDVVMPGMSGFELAATVRTMLPKVPVIYMSGYTAVSDDQMGAVVAPVLQKPSSPADLSQAIRAALEGRRS
ncbi:MAG: response regulator [Pseudomonadota bacterium]|nr:response regulator [Pseudomonadota bacterium]